MAMSTTFFDAIRTGDAESVRAQLRADPSLVRAREPKTGESCLHVAVQGATPALLRELLASGADLEAKNTEGRTALHDAIECGRTDLQPVLLEAGASVDICAASILGFLDRVRQLLDADPDLVNDRSTNLSPLGWASFGNQSEVAEELIRRGARMDDGEILCAASCGHVEVARVLMRHGADPAALDPRLGCNALHVAAGLRYAHDASDFIRMLLDAGIDPRMPTRDGRTALAIAEAGERRQTDGGKERAHKHYDRIVRLLKAALEAGPPTP